MYTLSDYLWMIADDARASAYATALRTVIAAGDRVLEVGAGFGFFSVVAARAGAAHVDAVDTNPAIHLGARVAAVNGCADRIQFHHRNVADLTLPRRADVLLIDLRGPTPFGSRSLEVLIDARDRLLRPGGRIIARTDRVIVAPTRTPSVFRREIHAAHGREGVNLDPVERIVFDTPLRCTIAAEDLITDGQCWLVVDYRSVTSTDGTGSLTWRHERGRTFDGFAVWFEADLADGIGFSTRPGGAVSAYKQMFIPLQRPVAIRDGDQLRLELTARQIRENYVWSWRAWLTADGAETGTLVADQNSLAEVVLDPAAIPLTGGSAIPSKGPRATALQALLSRIDGQRTIADLAAALAHDAPELFATTGSAHDFVTTWVLRLRQLETGET